MKHSLIYLLTTLLFFSCNQQSEPNLTKEITAIENSLLPAIQVEGNEKVYSLAERMEHYKVSGLSIAVVKDGKIRWTKGYGIADAETGRKVDKNTLFQAGSISKPLAAVAALQLVEKGELKLDEDIDQYLTDWKLPDSPYLQKEKITLRRLLTHTAGLNVSGFPGYAQTDTFPSIEMVLGGEGHTPVLKADTLPGSMWKYSGGGYTLMEKMVEDVSGMPLEAYMEKNVLKPLDMQHSTFAQPLPAEKYAYASAAFDNQGKMIEGKWHNYPEQAAAGLWTTATDLAKYCMAIQNGLAGEEPTILSKEMIEKMLTKHQFNWGLGPQLRGEGDSLIFQHGGKNAGFTNNMMAYAHQRSAIVVMTNSDNARGLIGEIVRSASQYYGWDFSKPRLITTTELERPSLEKLTGIYKSPAPLFGHDDYPLEVSIENDKLKVVDMIDKQELQLTPISETNFIDLDQETEVNFEQNEEQTILVWDGTLRFEKMNEEMEE